MRGKSLRLGMKMLLAGIASLALAASINVSSAEAAKSGDYTYTKKGNNITITRYTGKEGTVKIPSKIAGKKVTSIGPEAFQNNAKVKKIIVPEGVRTISIGAFSDCKSLKSVKLPQSLTGLDVSLFNGCKSLEKINIPEKISVIPMCCFEDCTSLKSIDFNGIEEIGASSFSGCRSLSGELKLMDVVDIKNDAFEGCSSITGVELGDSFETLGSVSIMYYQENIPKIQGATVSNPFHGCTSLTSFVITPTNVNFASVDGVLYSKSLEWLAAYPAGRSGEYIVPDTTKGIGRYAFADSLLNKIMLPDSVRYVCGEAFMNSDIASVRLPDESVSPVTYVGGRIFSGCDKLESITFPNGMRDNSVITFEGCTSLRKVTFPESFEGLKGEVFRGCKALNDIVLPEKMRCVPARCFMDCTSLRRINLDNIVEIGIEAFRNCASLPEKLVLKQADTIYARAFDGCTSIKEVTCNALCHVGVKWHPEPDDDWKVNVPDSFSLEGGRDIDNEEANVYAIPYCESTNPFGNCTSLNSISVPKENKRFVTIDGCLYTADMKTLVAVPMNKTGKFIVPYGVEKISAYAFLGSKMDEIVTSNSVVDIGVSAFNKCSMKKLVLSKSIDMIGGGLGHNIFAGASKLTNIEVKTGNSKYLSIDGVLYEKKGTRKVLLCYPPMKKGKEFVTVKNSTIAISAFDRCRYLKKLVISPHSKISTLNVVASNCNNLNIEIPSTVKKLNSIRTSMFGDNQVIIKDNCRNCKIYVKKKSPIIKRLKKYDVDYKLY